MNKRTGTILLTVLSLALSPMAVSKEKSIDIQEDSSGLPAELSENLARTSLSMGVKEPVRIRSSKEGGNNYVVVSGSSSTSCKIKLSKDDEPKILGVSCK
ncbi:hypothetical protein [Neisseria wadsworthii]|uniref:Uncharacterized protein n=1 Tax=Neisseria wadsworthii 9715 TaxID=1030841 RepID=G4CSE2_9NEIS|nr:hypothetical protein [Neisseria wadsworthii]EGZ44758.1 hypothetical protein HMPREF9370_2002 [Neisseria wadsworthii 9715]QMT35633.1 hypothetical protein H3L96_11595 [Neisseria wadsworthii]